MRRPTWRETEGNFQPMASKELRLCPTTCKEPNPTSKHVSEPGHGPSPVEPSHETAAPAHSLMATLRDLKPEASS